MSSSLPAHKFLVFTDLHITRAGDDIIGLDPLARFEDGLRHALANHGDADRIVITGDLTHDGHPEQYERLKSVMDNVDLPVTYLMGNHDHRDDFCAAFGSSLRSETGFIQSVERYEHITLIALDTLDETADPAHSGRLCADRLAWLETQLEHSHGGPIILALHHPPFDTGFAGMDRIALQNASELFALLNRFPNTVQIIAGHIHRTISGSIAGIPVSIFKSPCHQMPMMLGRAGSAHSVDEPGAYGIVLAGPDGIIIHTEDFAIAQAAQLKTDATSA